MSLWIAAALLVAGRQPARAQPDGLVPLVEGKRLERQLVPGEVHRYRPALPPGSSAVVVVLDQRGIDVVLQADDGRGQSIEVDAPTYRYGREVLLLPESAGSWMLEVRASSPAVGAGGYTLHIEDLSRAPMARVAAERAATAAGRSFRESVVGGGSASRSELLERAIASQVEALAQFRALGDRVREANALAGLGVLYTKLGEPGRALAIYDEALPLLEAVGERDLEAIVLTNSGLDHWKLGENDAAEAALRRAVSLQRALGNRYGEAIARNNSCLRAHSQGQLQEALACHRQVLDLLRELGELQYEALVSSNVASVYADLGEPREALDQYRRALSLNEEMGDRAGQALLLSNIAVVQRQIGQPQRALDGYSKALAIQREIGDRRHEASTLHNVGYCYYSLGEPKRALALLDQALALRREVGDRRGEAITLTVQGQVEASLGNETEAERLYRQDLGMRQALGDRLGEATALRLIGALLTRGDRPEEALGLLDRSAALLEELGDRREQALAWRDRGTALLRIGELQRARSDLERALRLQVAIEDGPGEIESRVALANLERRAGRPEQALEYANAALDGVESLRTRVITPDLRATFLASRREAYELAIELLMERAAAQPDADFAKRALAVSERSRARSLLDVLDAAHAELGAGVDPERWERRERLRERLEAKAARRLGRMSHGRSDEQGAREIYALIAELDQIEAEIRAQSPSFAELTSPRPLDVPAIQALLDPDTLLLEFALGAERSYLWVLSRERLDTYELPPGGEIETASRRAAKALGTLDPRGAGERRAATADLSRMLFAPLAARLDDQRLVIVPDGALHYVPFGALPAPMGAGTSSGAGVVLTARHEIVKLPSASALALLRRMVGTRTPAPRWALVVADPVFDAHDPRVERGERPQAAQAGSDSRGPGGGIGGLDLPRLPASRREAQAIAALDPAGTTVALDFDAQRELVLGKEARRYRILHLATHGLFDAEAPELSGLALSLVDRQGRARDGLLRLRDVYGLDLGADLVVLSGCRTALGREVRGEGLMGLVRGFFHAGAPRVVASLWRVEDRATAELMTHFYQDLARGETAAAALRSAQLFIREQRQWRDPYYWAAFELYGEWR